VEEDVAGHVGQSEREGGRDEVNLVAALGEIFAQFGCDDATPTVGWITGDADFHGDAGDNSGAGKAERIGSIGVLTSKTQVAQGASIEGALTWPRDAKIVTTPKGLHEPPFSPPAEQRHGPGARTY
jgi:hypothetical protein